MSNNRDYALVVGVEYYPLLNAPLPGAHEDATRFRDWLVGSGGLPDDGEHVELVLSEVRDKDPVPIQKQIDDAFDRIFEHAEGQGGGRRLYVYFAGHGGATEQRHVALLLGDATQRRLNSGLDTSLYHEGLALWATFPEQILFYDCCRNFDERFRGRGPDWTNFEAEDASARLTALPSVQQWVFYAAGFTQYANRREIQRSVQRGLFTTALLEGLHGKAARSNGTITMLSLADYVNTRLEELTQPLNLSQSLSWNPAGRYGDLVLAEGVRCSRTTVQVLAPAPVERATVSGDDDQLLESAEVQDGVATFQLPAGVHIFRLEPAPPTGRAMKAVNIPAQTNFTVQF